MTDPTAALARRVERLEAASEIPRLSADYCRGADHRDLDLFLSVWSEDGVWQVRDDLAFSGLEQIRDAILHQWETSLRAFHWTSNPSIVLSADGLSAQARFDVQSQVELLDLSWMSLAGSYNDLYVRRGDHWKLGKRAAEVHAQRTT
ncbi:MAG: nuclear transport factor 2 family protein [Pseudolysinimonas sp.]|uniref:nuclear transport factor 2 family protein n=1 Tax=Pseudolysinimonas sp. TaxID=2680009 RepID=UPI003C73D9A5